MTRFRLQARLRVPQISGALTPSGDIEAPTVPLWGRSLAVGEWGEISGSAISNLSVSMAAPNGTGGAVSRVEGWCGFVIAGTKIIAPGNGGHTDYWGNEVDAIDFSQASPTWSHLLASSTNAVVPANDTIGVSYYTDGTPTSDHSYGHLRRVPQRDWIVRVTDGAHCRDGGRNDNCMVYDVAANAYLPQNTVKCVLSNGNTAQAINVSNPCVFDDPATGNLYCVNDYTFYKWTQATNTWAGAVGDGQQYGHQAVGAVDTTRNRAIVLGGQTPAQPRRLALDTNTLTAITLGGSASTALNGTNEYGLLYDETTDLFYARQEGAGGTVHTVHPTTFAIEPMTTSGGASIPAAVNGVHNRWQRLSIGGRVFLLYLPNGTANFWALRIS